MLVIPLGLCFLLEDRRFLIAAVLPFLFEINKNYHFLAGEFEWNLMIMLGYLMIFNDVPQ